MPVLQWGMLCVLSLLLSIGFLAVHLPAALLLGPMIAGIIFSMRGITLQLPRSAFLAAQAIIVLTGMTTEITNPEGDILLMTDSNQALLPMKSRTQELKKPPHTTDTKNYSPKMKEST